MRPCKVSIIIYIFFLLINVAAVSADEVSDRVRDVSNRLGCEVPYMVAENNEAGGFFAETRLKYPQKFISKSFPNAQKGHFVSIRESIPGEYWVKVVPFHHMLDTAEEKLLVIELKSKNQKPNDLFVSGIIIKGVIANFMEVKNVFSPTTYLQLVDISPGIQTQKVVVGGFLNLASNLPKTSLTADGSFAVQTDFIKPGTYWLYLQNFKRISPEHPTFEPILAKGDDYYQIIISENVKTLIFDCGNLSVRQP